MKHSLVILLATLSTLAISAQESDSIPPIAGEEYHLGLFPRNEPPPLKQFRVGGWYRFFGTYTNMGSEYLLNDAAGQVTPERTIFIGDDSQLPNLNLNISGRPNRDMSFSADFYMFQFLNADLGETYGSQTVDSLRPPVYAPRTGARLGGGALGSLLGINLFGSYNTPIGSFSARMGGIHWYELSDLTFASFRGYNRFTLFERNPWDPVQRNVDDRYRQFYEQGLNQQDTRWGNRAFHGLIVEGARLPEDFSFSFLYGKTELNGGFDEIPNSAIGGRIRHESKNGWQSLNSFNSRTFTDSLAQSSIGFNIHTLEIDQEFGDFTFHGEMGAGRYYAPGYQSDWGEALNLKLKVDDDWLGFPFELQYYRLSPQVINNNAIFWNTSIEEVSNNEIPAGVAGSNAALVPFASSVVPIGLMTNNRTGVNLNADVEIDDLKLSLGYGVSTEIDPISNQVTYSHFVNGLTRSRFWRWNFVNNVGPYDRYSVVYRDAFETVQLTDDEFGEVVFPKAFNNAEILAKYRTDVFGKELYVLVLGRYSTVQKNQQLIIPADDSAYLRQYTSEMEFYYKLSPTVVWAGYAGYERVLANFDTEVDEETGRPRDQMGYGIGTGLDVSLGKNAVLVLRHRYFDFEDRSFQDDRAFGQETMAEIKVFF